MNDQRQPGASGVFWEPGLGVLTVEPFGCGCERLTAGCCRAMRGWRYAMSAVRIARGARLRRGVPAVVAGLVTVAALAAGSPAQASAAAVTHAAAARAAAGGTWGKAEEIPGIAALNKGGEAALTSVSCASAGNCSAGGYYQDSHY